jgi:hypothetical protein
MFPEAARVIRDLGDIRTPFGRTNRVDRSRLSNTKLQGVTGRIDGEPFLFGIKVVGSDGNINLPMRISHVGQHRNGIELPQAKGYPIFIN